VAKPRAIPGLSEDDAYAAVAARVVRIRTAEVAENAAGVLDVDEVEGVHDMRVATRRLRAALEVFEPCFPRKRYRAALGEVKALADALGERRDRDVTIASLRKFAAAVDQEDQPGLQGLIARLRAEQDAANRALAPRVTPERLAELVAMLEQLAAAAAALAGGSVSPPGSAALDPAALARHAAGNGDGAVAESKPASGR
jgi:CHAD domain-containing protein